MRKLRLASPVGRAAAARREQAAASLLPVAAYAAPTKPLMAFEIRRQEASPTLELASCRGGTTYSPCVGFMAIAQSNSVASSCGHVKTRSAFDAKGSKGKAARTACSAAAASSRWFAG